MAVKTITITEDAYDAVRRLKEGEESFSELFRRIAARPLTCKDILGKLKHSPEEAAGFARRVRAAHERIGEGLRRRTRDARARLKRAD